MFSQINTVIVLGFATVFQGAIAGLANELQGRGSPK
jgi:hypothetical protein